MLSQIRIPRFRRSLGVLFLISLTLCLWLGHLPVKTWHSGIGQVANAQFPDVTQLVQQGVNLYKRGKYTGAIGSWQTALNFYQKNNNSANEAIVRENLARAYEQIGQSAEAITHWEGAIAYYRQIKDISSVGRLLIEQAQSYNNLGQPRKAIALLCGCNSKQQDCVSDSALQIAHTYKHRQTEAAALVSLGNAYRLLGEYKQAIAYLQASLAIANQIDHILYQTSTLNSLGNTYINLAQVHYRWANSAEQSDEQVEAERFKRKAINYDLLAIKYFQDSLNLASAQNDSLSQLRVLLNVIAPYRRTQAVAKADDALQQALVLLKRIPDSRQKVYAAINLAHLLPLPTANFNLFEVGCPQSELQSKTEELLKSAITIARRIQAPRSESFALGELGHIYECRHNYQQALNFTRLAQLSAEQDRNSKDSLYLWQWQAGRIFKSLRGITCNVCIAEAIKAYERAITTLESIPWDILNANQDLQFDFRDNVDPIYRELTELRLEQASLPSIKPQERNKQLSAALNTIEGLKLAELQNYFGNDCVLTALNQARIKPSNIDTTTAVFSSIILNNSTAIIVSLPNGQKKLAWLNIDSQNLRKVINEFRRGLERYRDFTYDPAIAQQLYNWIVRPFAADLDAAQVKTLVFIRDGILRSVPMAALHDGRQFLVQKYAIANTSTFNLTPAKTLKRQKLRALILGVSKQVTVNGKKFAALENVEAEISQVKAQFPHSKQLLNDNFTSDRLQQELSKIAYSVIHIATHGVFGTDPEDTFLVIGNNDKLTIAELDNAIRSIPQKYQLVVELLTLTACQTAVGDDRAAIGLAGIAVQAGVKSALASLWFIQDAPTVTLITKFYASWQNTISKAEALRQAQTALIEAGGQYAHPAYWAAFILIGNWL